MNDSRPIIEQISADPELRLRHVIADMPERHFLRGLVSHQGKKSCEICIAEAVANPSVNWPYPECYGFRERTEEEMIHAARLV